MCYNIHIQSFNTGVFKSPQSYQFYKQAHFIKSYHSSLSDIKTTEIQCALYKQFCIIQTTSHYTNNVRVCQYIIPQSIHLLQEKIRFGAPL